MKKLAAILILIALSGCTSIRAGIADVQGFSHCEDVPQVDFREFAHDDFDVVRDICGPRAGGCAFWTGLTPLDSCTIHYEKGDEYTRRHECHHCAVGSFHP